MKLPARSTAAFILLALAASVQFLVIARLAAAQHDAAHLIDVSGTMRLNSQRIAYFASVASSGHPEAGWRAGIETSIAAIHAADREVASSRNLARVLDGAEQTSVDTRASEYFRAARRLEDAPSDAAAFARVRALRPRVLQDYQRIVALRARAVTQQNDQLIAYLVGAFAAELMTLMLVWFALIVPAERRLRRLLLAVSNERAQMQSLFDENPDAIAVYDDNGVLMRTNRARAELIGLPAAHMVGHHFSEFIEADRIAFTLNLFEQAKVGQRFTGELQLRSATGAPLDVHQNVFPNIVNGVRDGVMTVSRDMRDMKAAREQAQGLARRLAALCEIVSARENGDWSDRVEEALALAASGLGCEWGVAGDLDGDDVNVLAAVGNVPGLRRGMRLPLNTTMTQTIIMSPSPLAYADLPEATWREYNAFHGTNWRDFVGMRLMLDDRVVGAFALGGSVPRAQPLTPADCDFLKIVAALMSSIVERGRQVARLDTLAFIDTLTGLPNRAFISRELDALLAPREHEAAAFALHFIDLDKFKLINDSAGHSVGDRVLRDVAQRFVACARSTDIVARLGGDEFLILQPMATNRDGASELARRITRAVAAPFVYDDAEYMLGCSIGISVFPGDGDDAQTLLKRADEAMYRAKAAGVETSIAFAAA